MRIIGTIYEKNQNAHSILSVEGDRSSIQGHQEVIQKYTHLLLESQTVAVNVNHQKQEMHQIAH